MSAPCALDSLRQPEYTGDNRCTPCTLVNVALALAGSAAAAWLTATTVGPTVGTAAGISAFALATVTIYLRGYLVPGTPRLTKRYLPDRVLGWFDKAPEPATGATAAETAPEENVNPERALLDANAVEPCEDIDDLCLTDAFRDAWRDARTEDITAEDALDALGLDRSDCTLESHDDAYRLTQDGRHLAQWPSKAALMADAAGARALADSYAGWSGLAPASRGRLLSGLRLFVETCPVCDGQVSLGEETVESCCRSYEVVAVTCEDCEARLLEERWQG
ncbi:hypothetical protein [Halostella sp. PRR32]|uniref:hypothetical protein n=1 Tax=Halostella sp. PRR32 TaxID=3098147 RepID=UPI002B1E82F0|nr:hypothetical protein [Halostella sp. PRR32]